MNGPTCIFPSNSLSFRNELPPFFLARDGAIEMGETKNGGRGTLISGGSAMLIAAIECVVTSSTTIDNNIEQRMTL
jgi:hypothetical protein